MNKKLLLLEICPYSGKERCSCVTGICNFFLFVCLTKALSIKILMFLFVWTLFFKSKVDIKSNWSEISVSSIYTNINLLELDRIYQSRIQNKITVCLHSSWVYLSYTWSSKSVFHCTVRHSTLQLSFLEDVEQILSPEGFLTHKKIIIIYY